MVLSAKAGLEPSAMLELVLSSRARSGIIEMKAPQVLNRDFSPFFPLELMAKDMRLVQESAAALDLQLPIASALNAIYAECMKAGLAREDFCSAIKVLEQQADVTVQK
jgi:3-hydroxyisobutyrate dehydrogenase-like beta-hydroxyacid dehydrogenase